MAKGLEFSKTASRWTSSLILFVVSGFLAVSSVALVAEIKGISNTRQPMFDSFTAVCGPHTMGQDFVATAPNLSQIDVWLAWSPSPSIELTPTPSLAPLATPAGEAHTGKNFKYRLFLPIIERAPAALRFSTADYILNSEGCELSSPNDEGVIIISLKEDPASSEPIVTDVLRLDSVENPERRLRRPFVPRSFTFPAIPDSEGRTFYLSIESSDSSALAPLLARHHRSDVYSNGERYLDDAPAAGDLAFGVHYRTGPWGNLSLLMERLTRNRPAPFNWPWLYVLILAIYAGALALVIKTIAQKLSDIED